MWNFSNRKSPAASGVGSGNAWKCAPTLREMLSGSLPVRNRGSAAGRPFRRRCRTAARAISAQSRAAVSSGSGRDFARRHLPSPANRNGIQRTFVVYTFRGEVSTKNLSQEAAFPGVDGVPFCPRLREAGLRCVLLRQSPCSARRFARKAAVF